MYEEPGNGRMFIIVGISIGGSNIRYFKLVICQDIDGDGTDEYTFKKGNRYLVKIIRFLASSRYKDINDAIKNEPSNDIFYDITVDGADEYETNGRYSIELLSSRR